MKETNVAPKSSERKPRRRHDQTTAFIDVEWCEVRMTRTRSLQVHTTRLLCSALAATSFPFDLDQRTLACGIKYRNKFLWCHSFCLLTGDSLLFTALFALKQGGLLAPQDF